MKLVTFRVSTPVGPIQRIGALLDEEKIADLTSGYASYLREAGEETRIYEAVNLRVPPDMIEYLKGGELSKKAARQTIDYVSQQLKRRKTVTGPRGERVVYKKSEVKLMAPVPRPNTMRDFSTYNRHGLRAGFNKTELWYRHPAAYKGNPMSVIGPDEPIVRPHHCKHLDCELELGFYIGKEGRDIPVEKGDEYVAGYTIFNDVSDRDALRKDWMGPYKQKDFCNPMGPCLVTPDEIDYKNLKATLRVNGEVWFEGNTGARRHFFSPELVAYASENETLYPGDFLTGGTIDTGCSMDFGKWIEPGMIVEMEIEGIGVLRNPIIQGEQKCNYVSNGVPGHLEYAKSKDYEKEIQLPWEKEEWKNWKMPK